jgi:hypothetical protein
MASSVSNLYASKVYSEHPLALWALDDDFSFLSILSQNKKNISNWQLQNAETVDPSNYLIPSDIPLFDEIFSVITVTSTNESEFSKILGDSFLVSDIDTNKKSLCISAYFYPYGDLIESFEIGFEYDGQENFTKVIKKGQREWQKISHTIDVPNTFGEISPYIKINYSSGGPDSGFDYDLMVNAISVGQWSEPYNSEVTGAVLKELEDESLQSIFNQLTNSDIKVFEADAYGIYQENNGYYIVENNKMLSENKGMGMVFGSSNITFINSSEDPNVPSIILPGKGFLNSSGKFNELTAEFWLRLYTNSPEEIKIFGPIKGNDGLYVEEEFLTVKVGKYVKSYFIGKWYRPMLIDFRYSSNIISVLLNGELVISIDVDIENIKFPAKEIDYVGFYKTNDVQSMEIDCVGIYPYLVSEQLAKKRFIYGQGVDSPENIVSNFDGESIFIDFPYSKYTSTINYPDMVSWNSGFFNNLNATSKFLGFPNYPKPEVIFSGDVPSVFGGEILPRQWAEILERSWLDWTGNEWEELEATLSPDFYKDNFVVQDEDYPFIKLRPNPSYNPIFTTIYFDTINYLDTPVKSVFGIFSSSDITTEQVLFYFSNKVNSNFFKVIIKDSELRYIYNNRIIESKPIQTESYFIAGVEFDKISKLIGNFFTNPRNISLSLGNYEDTIFDGKIYSVTFNNSLFTDSDLRNYIGLNGIFGFGENFSAYEGLPDTILNYVGNYTMSILKSSDSIVIDVGVAGYWEDSIPLSYFGKYIKTSTGKSYYDLDMLQFNIDHPSPIIVDPLDIEDNEFKIRSFVTLQSFDKVGKVPYSNYSNTVRIRSSRVLDFDNTVDVLFTKYEIFDGTVIFPPKELVNFEDYYLTFHIESRTKGIHTKPASLKKMSVSSLAFDESNFYSLGTRTGNEIYPFTRYSTGYSYKSKNPFSIYKDSTPYLYLTSDSGITVLPYETTADRGVSIPLNQGKSSEYLLGGIQLWLFYNQNYFIEKPIKIGRVTAVDRKLDIYLFPEDGGKRGRINIFDALTGLQEVGVRFYQNGIPVSTVYIEPVSWNSLTISFDNSLNLNSTIGQLELYEGFVYNNIGLYQKSTDILGIQIDSFTWAEFREIVFEINGEIVSTLQRWENKTDSNWDDFIEEVKNISYVINGKNIYESYLGLPKAIVNDSDKILFGSDTINIITDVEWNQYSGRPV